MNPLPLNVPTILAKERGLWDRNFTARGTGVEDKSFQSGYEMTEAMAAGELDIAAPMGAASAIISRAGGRDIRAVAVYSTAPAAFGIVVPVDSEAKGVADLKGKTVAFPMGTEAHYLLAKALEEIGMQLSDVQTQNLAVSDAMVAVVGKKVAASILVEPVLSKAISTGKVRLLRDGKNLIGGYTLVVAANPFLRTQPTLVKRFLYTLSEAKKWLDKNPETAITIVARETKQTPELIRQVLPKYNYNYLVTYRLRQDLQKEIDFLFKVGLISKKITVADLLQQVN